MFAHWSWFSKKTMVCDQPWLVLAQGLKAQEQTGQSCVGTHLSPTPAGHRVRTQEEEEERGAKQSIRTMVAGNVRVHLSTLTKNRHKTQYRKQNNLVGRGLAESGADGRHISLPAARCARSCEGEERVVQNAPD